MLLSTKNLIMPYFVTEGKRKKETIASMPGIARFSIDNLLKDINELKKLNVNTVLLFGVCPSKFKDITASYAYSSEGIIPRAVAAIKRSIEDIVVITDVCLCAYASHGHCGIVKKSLPAENEFFIDNKETLKTLAKIALSHAEAGADYVAPSAMAENQVKIIRNTLNRNGYNKTKIMGYSAKFASNFYGPFRNAANSAPTFGDRQAYQLDFKDSLKALNEIEDDINEGADIVMVKPALSYLDVINQAKQKFNYPLAAYNVSGEYAFVKYGAKLGLWNERKMVNEIISSIKRAGADFIITYHAKDIARWIRNS